MVSPEAGNRSERAIARRAIAKAAAACTLDP
jgi:hypothetical protein